LLTLSLLLFCSGLQEFLEAYSFFYYLKHFTLVPKSEVDAFTRQFHDTFTISHLDYILGITDLTGELMRFATNQVTLDRNAPLLVRDFLQTLYRHCLTLPTKIDRDLVKKIDVMLSSVVKVETICYNLALQQIEFDKLNIKVPEAVQMRLASWDNNDGNGGGADAASE